MKLNATGCGGLGAGDKPRNRKPPALPLNAWRLRGEDEQTERNSTMLESPVQKAGVETPASSTGMTLGHERLLSIEDVRDITGLGEVTASKLMKESGRAIRLHRRLYVLESSFFSFLHEKEVTEPCPL